MADYSASHIRKTVWGEFAERADGSWETVWRLEFTSPHEPGEWQIYSNEEIGFDSKLTISETGVGELRVATRLWAMAAEYYSATFTSFRIVNDSVAEIATIQNLPRDWYAPFRDR